MADISNIKYLTLLVLIATATPVLSQQSSDDPALNAYRQGDYDKAIELYSELLAKNTDDKNIKFNLGGAFYKKGTLNSAKSGFEDALTLEAPKAKSRAYYNLGNTLFKMNKPEKSLEAFKYAMKFDPEDEDAKFNYEFVKSMLEENKEKQEGEDEQEEENEDSEEEEESDEKQDQNEQNKDEQDSEQEKEDDQKSEQEKERDKQQQKEKQKSQEEYQDILEALEQQEMQALKDYIKARTVKRRSPEKDW
ncbi:MAG: tetratricopeptide repeat protein [Candidatus Marinimicrobia bacterium]|nr:tetratricopeptide repeat protein [Candidatus Neomarinimicrobiota bacterium]